MTCPPVAKPAKARRPRKTPELDLQTQVAGFLRVATIAPARWWFVPNGANMSRAQAGRFKAAGLTRGVADLHFAWPSSDLETGWSVGDDVSPRFGTIEMKAGKGKLTPDQEAFRDDMRAMGHFWGEARSLEDVVDLLKAWGFPLRATVL
jgi:hypothetical protein